MIHHGDLFDVLPTIGENSVDSCCTDPPYGIGFMGREWDTFKPGTGAQRKLMHPRERIAAKIQSDNQNIHGRHRSPALSPSQIDYDYSAAGLRGFQQWTERWAFEVFRVLKPGAYIVVCGAPRSHHRMMCGLEDAGFVVRDCFAWLFGSGFPKNRDMGAGRGTALKPANEPIALAWKPFKGSITANVEKWGTGALNIDACRVAGPPSAGGASRSTALGRMNDDEWQPREQSIDRSMDLGRWPANVLLDEEAAAALDEMTGELTSGAVTHVAGAEVNSNWRINEGRADIKRRGADAEWSASVGGASRFYYVAKPSREERDYGTHGLIERPRDDSRKEGNPGGDNPRNRGLQPRGNFHPTVKPVELMRWLVKLVTPIGGTVLDPFTGSGTTGMACRYEQRAFIGIERETDYVQIAERRIAAVTPLFTQESA